MKLSDRGILEHFRGTLVLRPGIYRSGNPYGDYETTEKQGIGHKKPALRKLYDAEKVGFHPKERVLGISMGKQIRRIYPYSELHKRLGKDGGKFTDRVDDQEVIIEFRPEYQWAQARDANGTVLNRPYSYIFAVYQHIPDIEIYRNDLPN